jgi:CRP-like cAMP-binding protein
MPDARLDSVLAKKLNTFVTLSRAELRCLADLQSNPVKMKRGQQLTHEGQTGHKAFVLQVGWACSYKVLPNGGRQIISFPIAGDIVSLRSVLLRTADHSFSALTEATVSPLQATHIVKSITEFPRLGAALMWAASRDEAMVVEHLVSIGRRNAIERTAHFFMELAERLNFDWAGHANRVQMPAQSVRACRCLGLDRDPRQPGSASAARGGPAHRAQGHRQDP